MPISSAEFINLCGLRPAPDGTGYSTCSKCDEKKTAPGELFFKPSLRDGDHIPEYSICTECIESSAAATTCCIEIMSVDAAKNSDLPSHLFPGCGSDGASYRITAGAFPSEKLMRQLLEENIFDCYSMGYDQQTGQGYFKIIDGDAPPAGEVIPLVAVARDGSLLDEVLPAAIETPAAARHPQHMTSPELSLDSTALLGDQKTGAAERMVLRREYKARMKRLGRIDHCARMQARGVSRRTGRVLVWLIVGVLVGYAFSLYLGSNRAIFVGSLIGAVLAFASKAKTWETKIYDDLTAYEPLDAGDYLELQRLASLNKLTAQQVSEWAQREMGRMTAPPSRPSDNELARQRFATKGSSAATNADGRGVEFVS